MLEGKTVIITGGAMGIGRYMSHTFADAGANLVQLYTGLVYEGPGLVRKILKQAAGYGSAQ